MNRTIGIPCSCVFALVLTAGCRQYRAREFVAVQQPVKFEKWRLYVNVRVETANPSPTNHFYQISAVAWTAPGNAIGGNVSEFRPTAYDASWDSLRLFCIEGTNVIALRLPPLHHGSSDHPNRLVQLVASNGAGILLPTSASELRADVAMTLGHRDTGKTETRVFTTKMLKRERTKLAPLLE